MDYRSRRAVHAGDDDKPTDRAAFSYQPSLLNEVGALGFPIVSLRTRFLGALTRTGFFTLFIPAPSIPRYRLAEQEEERKLYSGPDCAVGGIALLKQSLPFRRIGYRRSATERRTRSDFAHKQS